jgi:uncharacterized protein (DUF58 family)
MAYCGTWLRLDPFGTGAAVIEEFHYIIPWRAASPHPGAHSSNQLGGGEEFAGLVPFSASPNARHIDIRASISDPFGQLSVRTFRQRSNIPVVVIADLSASMGYSGVGDKPENVARFAASAAWSAYRHGDRFGFIGGDERVREELFIPTRLHKGGVPELYDGLLGFPRIGRQSTGLLAAAERLGRQRALVFLVSDFHFPLAQLESILATLTLHDVVPVVVWDSAEYANLPSFGLVLIEDMETGAKRRLFMRPRLRDQFRERYAQRRDELAQVFRQHGRSPFFLIDRFDAEALTRYFLSGE